MKSLYSFDQYKENVTRLMRNLSAENLKLDFYFGCSTSTAKLSRQHHHHQQQQNEAASASAQQLQQQQPINLDAYPTIDIQIKAINNAITYLFRPDVALNQKEHNDIETLKKHFTGGISFDLFRDKSLNQILFKSFILEKKNGFHLEIMKKS